MDITRNNNCYDRHIDALPYNITHSVIKGSGLSFCVNTLLTLNPLFGIATAAFSTLMTLIDALIRPFINKFLPRNSLITQLINTFVVTVITEGVLLLAGKLLGLSLSLGLITLLALTLITILKALLKSPEMAPMASHTYIVV